MSASRLSGPAAVAGQGNLIRAEGQSLAPVAGEAARPFNFGLNYQKPLMLTRSGLVAQVEPEQLVKPAMLAPQVVRRHFGPLPR